VYRRCTASLEVFVHLVVAAARHLYPRAPGRTVEFAAHQHHRDTSGYPVVMVPDLGLLFRGQLYLGRLGLDWLGGLWLRLGLGLGLAERAALNRSAFAV